MRVWCLCIKRTPTRWEFLLSFPFYSFSIMEGDHKYIELWLLATTDALDHVTLCHFAWDHEKFFYSVSLVFSKFDFHPLTLSVGCLPWIYHITFQMFPPYIFIYVGITGHVRIDDNGDRDADYSILDLDPINGRFEVVAHYYGVNR